MKKHIGIIVLVFVSIFGLNSLGHGQAFDIDKIEIIAIKSLHLSQEGGNYYLDIVTTMRNSNEKTIKLRENNFVVFLGEDEEKGLMLGKAEPGEIILESKIDPASSNTDVKFSVDFGSNEKEVFSKLAYITNTIGNPQNNIRISIDGSCSIGTEAKKGWFYQSGFEMELTFKPKIQREVLFE